MSRKDALSKHIRAEWPARLDKELNERFWMKFETEWSVFASAFITVRVDGEDLTQEMISFIHGYMAALTHVYIWNGQV